MKKLFILFLLFISFDSFACSCEWSGNFLRIAKHSELIVEAKIIEFNYHSKDGKRSNNFEEFIKKNAFKDDFNEYGTSIVIEIISVLKGKEIRKQVEIYGADGSDCRGGLSEYKVGSFYIFSIYKSSSDYYAKQPNEDELDYSIGGCYESSLECFPKTNEVKGSIRGKNSRKIRIWKYDKFLRKLNKRI